MKLKLHCKVMAMLLSLLPVFLFGQSGSACSITGDTYVCEGGITEICGPANCAGYKWSTGETTRCIMVSDPGTYSLTLTNYDDSKSVCSRTLESTPRPDCSIDSEGSICEDGSVQLCALDGFAGYVWSTGETTRCISVRSNGNYKVTITNSKGCGTVCNKIIKDENAPDCTIIGDNLDCSDRGNTEICAADGYAAYKWSTGETTRCITVSEPGTFSITVTGNNGCKTTCSKRISRPFPSCRVTGENLSCTRTRTEICANDGYAAYDWNTGQTTRCITVENPGDYRVTITDQRGCRNVCQKTVTVDPPAICSIVGNDAIDCTNGSTKLCVSGDHESYKWSNGATTRCITVDAAGTYTVTVTDGTCRGVESIVVRSNVSDISCSISLVGDNGAKVIPTGGQTPYSYHWSNNASTEMISGVQSGTYRVTVTDANGCATSCEVTIAGSVVCDNLTYGGQIGHDQYLCGPGADPEPIVEVKPPSGGTGDIEYQWMQSHIGGPFNNISWEPVQGATSRDYDPGPIYETTYFIRCIRRAGCAFIEGNAVKIEVGDEVVGDIQGPELVCAHTPTTFSTSAPGAPWNFSWDFGYAATPRYATGSSPSMSFTNFGVYIISLKITQENCSVLITKRVYVTTDCDNLDGNDGGKETEGDQTAIAFAEGESVHAYPNPLTNQLQVEFKNPLKDEAQLQVYDINGKIVQTINAPANSRHQQLDFVKLAPGTYFLKVCYSKKDVTVVKVVKQ